MIFTRQQLEQLAAWQNVDGGYQRDFAFESDVEPFLPALFSSRKYRWCVLENGGMSNYFAIAVYPSHLRGLIPKLERFDGTALAVYLSALMPVGVMGWLTLSVSIHSSAWHGMDPEDVIPPVPEEGEIVQTTLAAFERSRYKFLDPETVNDPLPAGIVPFEYCYGKEPWDRVFHVLFSNTD